LAATRNCTATGNLTGINSLFAPLTYANPEVIKCRNYMQSNTTTIFREFPFIEFSYNTTLLFVCILLTYSCQNKARENVGLKGGPWIEKYTYFW
jgi:hypothetical protein